MAASDNHCECYTELRLLQKPELVFVTTIMTYLFVGFEYLRKDSVNIPGCWDLVNYFFDTLIDTLIPS